MQARRLSSSIDLTKRVGFITGVHEHAKEELDTIHSKAMVGTCQWITQRDDFLGWVEALGSSLKPKVFWLTGLPATGKTVLASYVVDFLSGLRFDRDCQYHFFSSGHQNKRTSAYCLRSIAFQLAHTNDEFRERLFNLHEETGISFSSQDQNFSVIWEQIFEGILFKMKLKPLFWVLDAIDEADAQSSLITSLMKLQSLTPINIFLTSRPTKIPFGPATFGSSIDVFPLSENDTINDIRMYVRTAVHNALPKDANKIKEETIDRVLAKAGGSFLWVKLAMETLQDHWHTQDDIRKVLTEVPKGMEYLYDQMLSRVESQSHRLRLMAKRILTWTVCCWRPLGIAEMQVALEPEFTGFVQIQETIVQICGNFISVDNGTLSLIHMTARQFLLDRRGNMPAFIDSNCGHEHVAITCLKHLSNDQWKRVFKTVDNPNSVAGVPTSRINPLLLAEQRHPFLVYATCHWAYHVSKASIESERLPAVLRTFFTKYTLSWIEAVALSRDLRHLIRSAQFLKAYTRRGSRNSSRDLLASPSSLRVSLEDELKDTFLWAVDFIRVAGKYGPNLLQRPSSIYRLIPPFCPRASMIGAVYGRQERSISVTGLSSESWDDCLSSVSVGKDETASRILTTNAYFMTLISSSGSIIIWHAETCEEARRIEHGEYVSIMEMDQYQTLLATAGTDSYRIWEISSGREMHRLGKTARALTMAISFGSTGSELMIGLDDCSVTCYDLNGPQKQWHFVIPDNGEFRGCPHIMKISPDLTKLAVAWKGRLPVVWDIAGTQSQRPLRCRTRSGALSPLAMQWQADGNTILILCRSTKLVEWHIYAEEQREFDHIQPHEMAISLNGNLLLTSNNMGTISVWTFPRLNLIYQLINENEYVESLAFSPDGKRFYDARGSTCNIWEPEALVRPDEQELDDLEGSIATEPIVVQDESSQTQVTALAYDIADRYFCAGREDGTVSIHDANDGKKLRKVSNHSSTSSILTLAWSDSNKYMISGDDSSRIVAKRLEVKGPNTWRVFAVFDFRLGEPVQQFLLNGTEKLLLISTLSADRIWDLKAKKELCLRQWGSRQSRRWIQHPRKRDLLIWIDTSEIRIYSWRALELTDPVQSPVAESTPVFDTSDYGRVVRWAALINNKQHIVYVTGPGDGIDGVYSSLSFEFISTIDVRVQRAHTPTRAGMAEFAARIKRLIGTYQDRIAFLDHDYWLCTWRFDAGLDDVEKHFFLPKDWLNQNTLHMATLSPHGTFFCPKHGDVAVVRHGMRF